METCLESLVTNQLDFLPSKLILLGSCFLNLDCFVKRKLIRTEIIPIGEQLIGMTCVYIVLYPALISCKSVPLRASSLTCFVDVSSIVLGCER